MWLTIFGYYISYRLLRFGTGNGRDDLFRRRFSIWFTLATICLWQSGLCHGQKDTGAFSDGTKSNNNAFQTAQKGSELGESASRGQSPGAGRAGNVHAVQTQVAANNGGSAPPTPSQNQNAPAPRPSLGTVGDGPDKNDNGEVAAAPDRNVNSGSGLQPQLHQPPPAPTRSFGQDQEQEQEQEREQPTPPPRFGSGGGNNAGVGSGAEIVDGPPQPQSQPLPQQQPQPQTPHAQFPRPVQPATANKPRGGVGASAGDEKPIFSAGKSRGGVSVGVGDEQPNLRTTSANIASGDGIAEAATLAPVKPIGARPGARNGPAKSAKVHLGSGGSNVGVAPGLESGDGPPRSGSSSGEALGGAPKFGAGPVSGTGPEEGESELSRGPPGATPNTPQLPPPSSGVGNGRIPADGGLRPIAPSGPQLLPRSGPSAPPLQQQGPLDPVRPSTPPPLAPQAGAIGQGSETGIEDAASGALIKAVNDEYVEVVKNLTDAGVLTEVDYESKPVSDLFAILLEKLINANPGASEDDQRHLVHQAGVEFVEVFKANAASTKNVTEIVRLVTEQLQSVPLILNEAHPDVGLGAVEPATPSSFNPSDAATSVRFGQPGRVGNKNAQSLGEGTPSQNGSLVSNHSGVPIHVITPPPISGNGFGSSRRPINNGGVGQAIFPANEASFPGPPGIDGELEQNGSTPASISGDITERITTRHGFTLFPPGGGGGLVQGIAGASSPAPPFGFQNVPTVSKSNGFNNVNGQITNVHDFNATNSKSLQNGTSVQESFIEVSTTTEESTTEGPVVIPVGNPRFPFPAHAPSTLRPPLRFFTTSSVATTTGFEIATTNGPNHPPFGVGPRGDFGSTEQPLPPFAITPSPPGFVPGGRSPASGSADGRIIIGGTPGAVDVSSGNSDFPTPPTWDFSTGEPSSIETIGGEVDSREGIPSITPSPPAPPGGFVVARPNSTLSPILGSSTTSFGRESSFGNNGTVTTQESLISTTSEEAPAPFTHEVHDIFGNNNFPVATSTAGSVLVIGADSTNSTEIEEEEANVTQANNTSTEGWLVFGSGQNSNLTSTSTSKPFGLNASTSTLGEAFVTESSNSSEIVSESGENLSTIRTSTDFAPIAPVIIPGLESGIQQLNISSNGTTVNVTSTIATGLLVPVGGIELTSTTQPSFGISSDTSETSISSIFGESNETATAAVNVSSTSGVFVIGAEHEHDKSTSWSTNTESTISGISGSSTESTLGIWATQLSNETASGSSTMRGLLAVTVSGVESSTIEEEVESGSGSGDSNSTLEIGSGGGISLPTRPILSNITEAPGGSVSVSEIETSTVGSGLATASGSSSTNPMLIWSFRIIDQQTVWDSELLNKESFQFKDLHSSLVSDLTKLFKTLEPKRFVDVTIKRFSKGSVIVDGQTEWSERVDSAQLLESFVKLVSEQKNTIGGRQIDESSITFDRIRPQSYSPQSGTSNTVAAGGTPNWVIALVVAVVLLALIIIAAVVVIKRRKRQASRDNYMVDEETMNGGAKSWPPNHRGNQPAQGQQHSNRGAGLANGRDQYAGVNMYEMKEPAAPNAHMNYGYQSDRAANGHGAHGRSVTEINVNEETNVDNETTSKH